MLIKLHIGCFLITCDCLALSRKYASFRIHLQQQLLQPHSDVWNSLDVWYNLESYQSPFNDCSWRCVVCWPLLIWFWAFQKKKWTNQNRSLTKHGEANRKSYMSLCFQKRFPSTIHSSSPPIHIMDAADMEGTELRPLQTTWLEHRRQQGSWSPSNDLQDSVKNQLSNNTI